ncbi:uncharacterized protein LOC131025545 [Salvia miltiorrhiza]|uniref:uncharacterized protein LOC131025545 n=1 Tax=Salvia miltiorrhiza TaxID=226208 RepID=UPI0025ABF4C7|nr:uncharacterized protein LOC131025545 [Salvia miltiorrhiza]
MDASTQSGSNPSGSTPSGSGPSGSGPIFDNRPPEDENPNVEEERVASDGRTWVYFTRSVLRPTGAIRARATDSFQGMPHESGTNWKNLTEGMKDFYFDEFEKAFCWDKTQHTRHVIKKAWVKAARVAYKDYISNCKKVMLIHKKKIDYLQPNIEAAWRAYWALPETQARSAQASRNRRSEPGGPGTGMAIHHGGSRSALDHAEHLARESNISFDEATWATFRRIHYKNGQYTAGRPAQHGLEVERRLAELRQTQEEVTPVDVDRIFREVVTPDSRGRIMGLGMMMSRAITESGESSSTHSTSTSQFPFPVASRDELITLRGELSSTQRELEVRRASEEVQSRAIQEMQAQIALLMRGYHAQSPSDASDGTHPDL